MKDLGLTQPDVEAARAGQAVEALTEQQLMLVRFARRVAERPRQIEQSDVQALHAVGLDDASIMEALAVCMMSAWTNTLAETLKFDQDMEAFGLREGFF